MAYDQGKADLLADLAEIRDNLTGLVVDLQNRVSYLESEIRRVSDVAQNADYLANDAKRAADDAASAAQRGW
jgi:hypothetical protein